MKAKILFGVLCMLPMVANAAIQYRVEQPVLPQKVKPTGEDSEAYARDHRFYIGGSYNFSIWDGYTDKNDVHVGGKNSSGLDIVAGIRGYDTFRVELNYIHTDAKYSHIKTKNNLAMVNAIFDARIDNLYRLFYNQKLVPYVGVGGGMSWNSSDAEIEKKNTPAVAALAGLGLELGDQFTVDFGYRYLYIFSPKFEEIFGLNPCAHQFRAGVRIGF